MHIDKPFSMFPTKSYLFRLKKNTVHEMQLYQLRERKTVSLA